MNLDISQIPVENLTLSLVKQLCDANKPEKIIISGEQNTNIFCSGYEKWTHYRDIELVVNNRVTLEIPDYAMPIIEIDGYKFFRHELNFQCVTCLNLMGIQPIGNKDSGGIRKLKLIKDCDCPRQK